MGSPTLRDPEPHGEKDQWEPEACSSCSTDSLAQPSADLVAMILLSTKKREPDLRPTTFIGHTLETTTTVPVLRAEWQLGSKDQPHGTELDMAPPTVVIIFSFLTHVVNNSSLSKLILISFHFNVLVGCPQLPGLVWWKAPERQGSQLISALSCELALQKGPGFSHFYFLIRTQ